MRMEPVSGPSRFSPEQKARAVRMVFEAILRSATRLCSAERGIAFRYEAGEFHCVAAQGNPAFGRIDKTVSGTERHMQDGPYNDVWPLHYSRFPDIVGAGRGFIVDTEADLDRALHEAHRTSHTFSLLDVHLAPLDRSPALDRLAARLARRI